MRTPYLFISKLLVFCALLTALSGCGKGDKADATVALEESFQSAEPATQEAVNEVRRYLDAEDYASAARTLAPIVDGQPLTDAQRQAVGSALKQMNRAVAANPSLDTREMYELRAKMFRAVDSGPRF